MKKLVSIEPIAVKDKNDVVSALRILEKLGIHRMTEEQKENYLADENRTVDNNFMMQEEDGGFRIQSHYIGFGISIESLEKQVNDILEKYPNICEKLVEIENKRAELEEEVENKRKQLEKEIRDIEIEIDDLEESNSIIELKE